MLAIVSCALTGTIDYTRCLDAHDAGCVHPEQPRCRIHTDKSDWEHYRWRNAYTLAASDESADMSTHEYAFCSNGTGPWKFTGDLQLDACAEQARTLNAKCFDYACDYHEAANCTCPSIAPIKPQPNATQVACVGDSITAGYLSTCGLTYPNQLQSILGDRYAVTNYGVGGTTLLKHGDHPYWATKQFHEASSSAADIVIIMLGTNDAKPFNWRAHGSEYPADYKAMIDVFKAMPSTPTVLVMTPPPLYQDGVYGMEQAVINTDLPGLVPQIAADNGLSAPIDLFALFQGHCPVRAGTPGHPPSSADVSCDWIGSGGVDACHPSNVGYGKVAATVAPAVVEAAHARWRK